MRSAGGGQAFLLHLGRLGKASLKVEMEQRRGRGEGTMWASRGRVAQAEGVAGTAIISSA